MSANKPARVLVVDDHPAVRDSLQDMLADEPSIEVVGEAHNGREAVELSARARPDLILMDVRMPEMDGLEATRAIKRAQPGVSVLMVTIYEDPGYLLEALKAGVAGYVLKESSQDEIIAAVLRILSGDSPLDPTVAQNLLRQLVDDIQARDTAPPGLTEQRFGLPIEGLTPRELEVLRFVARGSTNRDIADTLVISRGTVKRHVENLIRKLGVSDRTQAAVRAYELGLVGLSGS
ncbi:MAG: response regulator transcription factor [Rubrobacter sp.]|nr:response regulator transcription factor [Rubrobacter sp.]